MRYPLISRLFLFVILPLVIVVIWFGFSVLRSLPSYSSEYTVPFIDQPIEIHRDAYGVPKIIAKTDQDLFFAMGFVQAQDRLWQMEVNRRLGEGRLAEVLGASSVSTDISMRTYGLALAAEQAYISLASETKAVLQAYSDGVNAWVEQADKLPPEFSLFSLQPEPWRPVDSVLVGKMLALRLAFGIQQESDRQLAAAVLSPAQFANLYPGVVLETLPTEQIELISSQLNLGNAELSRDFGIGITGVGSNAWVVSGKHTDTGRPILAGDPHLAVPIPSYWYQAELNGPVLKAKGVTVPGLPVIVFGHNEFISWNGTNFSADAYDYVIEQIDPSRQNQYKTAQGWKSLQTRQETIHVRTAFPGRLRPPARPIMITVTSTENGPLIGYQNGDTSAMALKWTALQPEDQTMTALLQLNYASDWHSFRAALSLMVAPTINFLYADQLGNIGYAAAGHIPIRRNSTGILPTPQHKFAWTGMIPWEEMPQQFNPASGYIVNANQNNIPADYPYYVSYDWLDPARANRIEQLLQHYIDSGNKLTLDSMRKIQLDQLDMVAPRLIKRWCTDPEVEKKYTSLCSWDGNMQTDPAAAALYQLTLRHLTRTLFSSTFATINDRRLQQRWVGPRSFEDLPTRQQFKAALDQPELWCEPKPVGCRAETLVALGSATAELTRLQGSNSKDWAWHNLAPRIYENFLFSQSNASRSLFERKVPGVGSYDTVNVGGYRYDPLLGYQQFFGASYRQVIVSEAHGFSYHAVNSTGQSGHPFSSHYADQLSAFTAGQLIPPTDATRHLTLLRPHL
ncbi:penicillin acylase family protein [Alkalimonas amylolytica]|uniref:penicillin acylase family protein n=1 Tax=Alkalimonas amylolytica TaxID=152573 RepID=UPI0014958B5F|nr:penicillin acylase family protein [Alkalimonas amylolytica]